MPRWHGFPRAYVRSNAAHVLTRVRAAPPPVAGVGDNGVGARLPATRPTLALSIVMAGDACHPRRSWYVLSHRPRVGPRQGWTRAEASWGSSIAHAGIVVRVSPSRHAFSALSCFSVSVLLASFSRSVGRVCSRGLRVCLCATFTAFVAFWYGMHRVRYRTDFLVLSHLLLPFSLPPPCASSSPFPTTTIQDHRSEPTRQPGQVSHHKRALCIAQSGGTVVGPEMK